MNGNIELDDTLQVLTSHYRRWTLHLLMEQKATTVDELVPKLCALGEAVGDESATETQITTRLHHVDLPKLVDRGLVKYDRQNENIVLDNEREEVKKLLAMTKEWEHSAVQSKLP